MVKLRTNEYRRIHQWVERKLGTPSICFNCLKTDKKRYEWANISGEHKKELSDWIRYCVKCHREIDSKNKVLCRKLLHELVGDNVYYRPNGYRQCHACKKTAQRLWEDKYRRGLAKK